jgi:hypothetical protein
MVGSHAKDLLSEMAARPESYKTSKIRPDAVSEIEAVEFFRQRKTVLNVLSEKVAGEVAGLHLLELGHLLRWLQGGCEGCPLGCGPFCKRDLVFDQTADRGKHLGLIVEMLFHRFEHVI